MSTNNSAILYGFTLVSFPENSIKYKSGFTPAMEKDLNELLESPNWLKIKNNTIMRLTCNSGEIFHIHICQPFAYIVSTSSTYKEEHVYATLNPQNKSFIDDVKKYILSIDNNNNYVNINWYARRHNKMFETIIEGYKQGEEDKIKAVQKQVANVTSIMLENINKLIVRGEQIENLETKTNELSTHAKQFYANSTKLERTMRCRSWKLNIAIGAIVLIVLGIVIAIIAI